MKPLFRPDPSPRSYRNAPPVTIRWANASDLERLEILAELDSARIPSPPLLLGFVGEDLWAARSLATGRHIADPFRPSAEVARLLAERGRQLTVPERRRFRLPSRSRHESALRITGRLGGEPG